MTADEIRRTKKTILILRDNYPIQTTLPPVSAIAPFRRQCGINPFHGKPFRQRVQLRLRRRGPSLLSRIITRLTDRRK